MTPPTISGISPLLIVTNVRATLSFYRDMLGFEVTFRGPAPDDEFFGIVRRDGAMIMFKAPGRDLGRQRRRRRTGRKLSAQTSL